jgi:hypothetical protein
MDVGIVGDAVVVAVGVDVQLEAMDSTLAEFDELELAVDEH